MRGDTNHGLELFNSTGEVSRLQLELDSKISNFKREQVHLNLQSPLKSCTRSIIPSNSGNICLNSHKRVSLNLRHNKDRLKCRLILNKQSQRIIDSSTPTVQTSDLKDIASFYDSLENEALVDNKPTLANTESLLYDPESLAKIREAGESVTLGLETEFMRWNTLYMRFESIGENVASFTDYLWHLSCCGSLIRRLLHVSRTIKSATQDIHAPLCLLAVSTVIEREVVRNQRLLSQNIARASNLVDLLCLTETSREEVQSLATIIGCDDLQKKGQLSRIPGAVEVLERVFSRAVLLDSPLLWRVATAVMKPWIDQLNFVTGLELNHSRCLASVDIQRREFPELFIVIDPLNGQIVVDKSLVPQFLPMQVAEATVACYKLLCFASEALPEVSLYFDFATTKIKPLVFDTDTSISSGLYAPKLDIAVPAFIEMNSNRQLHAPRSEFAASNQHYHQTTPRTVFTTVFDAIFRRAIELNLAAKSLFIKEFMPTLQVITELYLLNNGRFWSLLIDLLPKLQSPVHANQAYLSIQQLITAEFGNIEPSILAVVDSSNELGLRIEYDPPKPVEMLLQIDGHFWAQHQKRFTKLLVLHYTDQAGLRKYSTAIKASVDQIRATINSDRAGLFELVAVINEIPS